MLSEYGTYNTELVSDGILNREEKSKELLMGTEMSVTEVAYAAGFSRFQLFYPVFPEIRRNYTWRIWKMLRFSYETLTNSWFYGEWIVKIIAKVMILIIHFVLHKKRRETMKDDKKEKVNKDTWNVSGSSKTG